MVAYTKPQRRKKEESERRRGERDQIEFTDLRFEKFKCKSSNGNKYIKGGHVDMMVWQEMK